ncbi:MAG TPA: glycosyltransferase [Blastocatellia bacterium]|nr:glycosyltransferase [Blastocatellia bacterium]
MHCKTRQGNPARQHMPTESAVCQSTPYRIPAAFVHLPGHLTASGGGGVQHCTREYYAVLEAAGFDLQPVELTSDSRLMARLKRQVSFDPYGFLDARAARSRLGAVPSETEYVFLNTRNVGAAARWVRQLTGDRRRVVMLSHGLESVDFLHTIQPGQRRALPALPLGRYLLAERACNRLLDHIFCLSLTEVETERWLGSRSVSWLPRMVGGAGLVWEPRRGRLGFVGTVDHPPNREGLIQFLEALEKLGATDVRVRLVGGPEKNARAIAARFPIVEYLGRFDDRRLEEEAATWACFLHPLFVFARGCSTKLAVALGWRIPIATTPAGVRGYTWREGRLPLAETPEDLARLALRLMDETEGRNVRSEVERIAGSTPSLKEVSCQVRRDLGLTTAARARRVEASALVSPMKGAEGGVPPGEDAA